jgi:hypothetical protein
MDYRDYLDIDWEYTFKDRINRLKKGEKIIIIQFPTKLKYKKL